MSAAEAYRKQRDLALELLEETLKSYCKLVDIANEGAGMGAAEYEKAKGYVIAATEMVASLRKAQS